MTPSQDTPRGSDYKFRWTDAILDCDLHDTTKLVGLTLATAANAKGQNSHLGCAKIAQRLNKSVRSVKDHLKRLRDDGWIIRTYNSNDFSRRDYADVYALAIPDRVQQALHPVDPWETSAGDGDRVQSGAHRVQSGVDRVQPALHPNRFSPTGLEQHAAPNGAAPASPRPTPVPASQPPQDWETNSLALDQWLERVLPEITQEEWTVIYGMQSNGRHPRAIFNKILKMRLG
ncbi:UNVERIFIED_ORG: DNA-binding Lrp family transcriptional regulator [Arthrobacter globiformis]|nr:DNA-binding Lrp family transcriptional regulator [Arthrobacter globiformis]